MSRACAIAELAEPAPNGAEGEGVWRVRLPDGHVLDATVQPTKDVPGEKWIARTYHRAYELHFTGTGMDALDAVLGIIEDVAAYRAGSWPRIAVTADTRAARPHRAEQLELGLQSVSSECPRRPPSREDIPGTHPPLGPTAPDTQRPTRAEQLARAVAARRKEQQA